jgi:hypothetical protein
MMKRYRETLEEVEVDGERPVAFCWRGRRHEVVQVLGHWHEDAGWWRRSGGAVLEVERTDLWRVEVAVDAVGGHGIHELVRRGAAWRLDRVWD